MNFWKTLPKPFFALAPMADVTDISFRSVIAKYSRHGEPGGGPDVFWTEFVSADGLASAGREHLLVDLKRTDEEQPIVAQIFGSNLETIRAASKLVAELGFAGVDINMGCPDRSIEKQGAGAALMKDPERATDLIAAMKQGVVDGGKDIPVSVKTRTGFNKDEIDTWIPALLSAKPDALTIHARTRKEMSLVPARWEDIARVVEMAKGTNTVIIGNGDIVSLEEGLVKAKETGVHGVMVGRGIFGNPWFFDQQRSKKDVPLYEQFNVMLEHTDLFEKHSGEHKNFAIMRKHYSAYVRGFDGAKELRVKLMEAKNATEVRQMVEQFLKTHTEV